MKDRREEGRAYYRRNRDLIKEKVRLYEARKRKEETPEQAEARRMAKRERYKRLREQVRAYQKNYRDEHADKFRTQALASYYRQKGIRLEELKVTWRRYKRSRWKSDPLFRLHCRIRLRVFRVLNGRSKSASTKQLLGCDMQFLRNWLENHWQQGMSWANYGSGNGKWNMDHVRPCASFDLGDPAAQKACFHYSNIRPCWNRENMSKGSLWGGKRYRYAAKQ